VFFGPSYWATRGSRKLKETWKTGIGGHMIAENMQFNHLMQFFSPDVLFKDGIAIDSSYELRVLGLIKETGKYNWSSETPPTAERLDHSAQYVGGLVGGYGAGTTNIIGNHNFLNDFSFFGPTNDSDNISTQQTFRQFNGNLYPATTNEEDNTYKVYGNPEITDEGANFKNYNNDPRLRYSNNLKTMIQDNFDGDDANDGAHVQLLGVNSNGSKCITFALGSPITNNVFFLPLFLRPFRPPPNGGLVVIIILGPPERGGNVPVERTGPLRPPLDPGNLAIGGNMVPFDCSFLSPTEVVRIPVLVLPPLPPPPLPPPPLPPPPLPQIGRAHV
jgi:hypothetical protein